MRHVRLGVVGCGAIATTVHLRNARRLSGVDVTAIADASDDALERAARLAPGASRHRTAEELLAQRDVDAVVVTTPSDTHASIARAVLAARRHLYLEKPVATTIDDGLMVADAQEQGVVATVGFNRRFHPLVQAAAARLARGDLGPVVSMRSRFEEPLAGPALPAWKRVRATGGGAPLDLGSHHVDLARHLLGADLTAERADIRSVHTESDDCTLWFHAGPCEVEIECSFVRGRADTVVLVDEAGRSMELDRYAGTLTVRGRRARGTRLVLSRTRAILRPLADPSYRPALRAFADRVRGSEIPLPTLDDGLASLRAVLAAEASADRGAL